MEACFVKQVCVLPDGEKSVAGCNITIKVNTCLRNVKSASSTWLNSVTAYSKYKLIFIILVYIININSVTSLKWSEIAVYMAVSHSDTDNIDTDIEILLCIWK